MFAQSEIASLFSPALQAGFAGFCLLLTWLIFWLIRQLLAVLKETNVVIGNNTKTIETVHSTADDTRDLLSQIKDDLFRRPCLLDREDRR